MGIPGKLWVFAVFKAYINGFNGYYGVYHGLLGLKKEIICMMDHQQHDLLLVKY